MISSFHDFLTKLHIWWRQVLVVISVCLLLINDISLYYEGGSLVDYDTRVVSSNQKISINGENEQEINMFIYFSKMIYDNKTYNCTKEREYCQMLTLLTQSVTDSCMVSMKMEGKEVHIDSYFSLLKGLLYNV
jgi:hypothetical protein